MQDLKKNRYIVYLGIYALYVLKALLDIISRIQRFDYAGNKKNILVTLTVLYAGFIFYLSSQSNLSIPSSAFKIPILYELADILKSLGLDFFIDLAEYAYHRMDKVAHMFLYFGMGVLLHLTFRHSDHVVLRKYAAILAIFLGILYGISDEYHQSFVPGRSSSIHDILADGIGVTIAQIIFVVLILINIWRKKGNDDQKQA